MLVYQRNRQAILVKPSNDVAVKGYVVGTSVDSGTWRPVVDVCPRIN